MTATLRITEHHKQEIHDFLFQNEQQENIIFCLAGYTNDGDSSIYAVHKLIKLSEDSILSRSRLRVTWDPHELFNTIEKNSNLRVIKIHSHLENTSFSKYDDKSDVDLFPRISAWMNYEAPGISAIMYSDSTLVAREVNSEGSFTNVDQISVIGDDLRFRFPIQEKRELTDDIDNRTVQVLGNSTASMLKSLKIAIIGISGTGSPVCEMLARLGVGHLVLVDDDKIEAVNLGRIVNSTKNDAELGIKKVEVQKRAISQMGFDTEVDAISASIVQKTSIDIVKTCDVIFGCVDSIEARHVMNKIARYYLIPLFDLGVNIRADGEGGIDSIWETLHFIKPDGASLLERDAYTLDALRGDSLRRENPEGYKQQQKEKYIIGGNTSSPAVISVNFLIASIAVNDFLCRIHQIRDNGNSDLAQTRVSISQNDIDNRSERDFKIYLPKDKLGLCDTKPLLNMPTLESNINEDY